MPINKLCHHCGKSDKPVYERYQCAGTTMEFNAEPFGEKLYRIVPKNLEYWCADCHRIENEKVEIIDE